MHWDGTITLGNLLMIVSFLFGIWGATARTFSSLDKRVTVFEKTIVDHSSLMVEHTRRMDRQDDALIKIMGEIQRVMGRLDTKT